MPFPWSRLLPSSGLARPSFVFAALGGVSAQRRPCRAEEGHQIQSSGERAAPHRIVIVGGGVMGSSIAWQLARQIKQQQGVDGLQAPRNVEITLIDSGRFPRLLRGAAPRGAHSSRVPHIITTGFPGSSWGESRIARLAYSDPMKVGLMQKAFRFFKELECDQHEVAAADPEQSSEKRTVLHKTACLDVGDCGDEFVLKSLKGLMATYEKLGLGYEVGFYARDGLDGKLRWAVQSSAQGVDGTVVDAATQRESDIEKLVRSPTSSPALVKPIQLRPGRDVAVFQKDGANVMAAEVVGALHEAFEGIGEGVVNVNRGRTQTSLESAAKQGPLALVDAASLTDQLGGGHMINVSTRFLYGRTVDRVDIFHKKVFLRVEESGPDVLPYDQVVLATGSYTNKMLVNAKLPLLPIVATNEQSIYLKPKPEFKASYMLNTSVPQNSKNELLVEQGRFLGCDDLKKPSFPVMIHHVARDTQVRHAEGYNRALALTDEKKEIDIRWSDDLPPNWTLRGNGKVCGCYANPIAPGGTGLVKLGAHRQGEILMDDENFILRQDTLAKLYRLPNADKLPKRERSDALQGLGAFHAISFAKQFMIGLDVDKVAPWIDGAAGAGVGLSAAPAFEHSPGSLQNALESTVPFHLRCLYTQHTMQDEDFIVGRFPSNREIALSVHEPPRASRARDARGAEGLPHEEGATREDLPTDSVYVATGFGGEGFKFSVAIGDFVAKLVMVDCGLAGEDVIAGDEVYREAERRFSVGRCFRPEEEDH